MKLRNLVVGLLVCLSSAVAVAQERGIPDEPKSVTSGLCAPIPSDPSPNKVWTYELQCDRGTRDDMQRIFPGGNASMPGVEVCAVVWRGCAERAIPNSPRVDRDAVDSGQPLAIVIFGINRLVDKPGGL